MYTRKAIEHVNDNGTPYIQRNINKNVTHSLMTH